jgi:adenylate kinase family enzyme
MKRVMIVGGPGSGKSTLARLLGERTGLPVFHMDLIHWQDNWVERTKAEKIPLARAVEAREEWVFEGNMSATNSSRLARADTLIWLDLPVGLRLWRVTKRLFRYLGQARPDLPPGCRERLHPQTWAFYRLIWSTRHSARAKITALIQTASADKRIVHLTSPRALREWLKETLPPH